MSGIAGITLPGQQGLVKSMVEKLAHRGPAGKAIVEGKTATLGAAWSRTQFAAGQSLLVQSHIAQDGMGHGHLALAEGDVFLLKRDAIGVAPLYFGRKDGNICFASEVKGLLAATRDVHELLPGHVFDGRESRPYFTLSKLPHLADSPEILARELRRRLETAVQNRIENGEMGAWLSGGLDSSTFAALARPHVREFHTFVAGIAGAADLEFARIVAEHLGAQHHEVIVKLEDMLAALPDVIYNLESFDALLVRSSITNYLAAKRASDYVPAVFSGEGGDELFAGYDYLKSLDPSTLEDELIDITSRLHNTALQRVDRSASGNGIVAHVCFLDPEVFDFALRIPPEYKLRGGVEKWILRQAMAGALPDKVLNRPKAKFWQGAGVENLLETYANDRISDNEFERERHLENALTLNTKEELFYYRIFHEQFGDFDDLSWMGRTKGAPVA
jgi:asparagine synthase (glutamine-hydrolysing)